MAQFFGTSRQDIFLGLSTENNLFSFRPGVLQAFDSIIGGTGSFLDTIAFTSSARVQAGKFDTVSNIEVVRLDVPGIQLTVSRQLVETSQTGFLTVEGSSGSDFVSGQPTNPSRAPVTGSIHFNGNGGADTFNGGEGNDVVTVNRDDLGASTLNGFLGTDDLLIVGDGLISAASFTNVSSFENIVLRGEQELIIPEALQQSGLSAVFGNGANQVFDARAVSQNPGILYFYPGDGSDTFFGGAETSIWASAGTEIDSGDFFDAGVGAGPDGGYDFLQIFGNDNVVTAESLGSFLNIDGFQVFGNNTSVTLNANQANTADGYISALYAYGVGSTIDASAVSGDQFVIDVFLGQSNTYIGTQGADVILLNDFNGNFVNGFTGLDQVQLNDLSSPDLTDLGAVVDNVESIYLQPSTPDVLFLDPSDIPDITGGGPLIIGRDPNQDGVDTSIESSVAWTLVASGLSQFDVEQQAGYQGVWFLGNSFNQYEADGQTVFVEESITAFGGIVPSIEVTTLSDEGYDGGTLEDELADGGGLSLREAIGLAGNDSATFDRITFNADLSGGTIVLDAFNGFTPELELFGQVDIDGDIDGDGIADITIDGDGQTRIFHIQNPGDGLQTTVTLNGLALTDGYADNSANFGFGGAVLVEFGAEATIRNSQIRENSSSTNGGGIAVNNAALTLENSVISGNTALGIGVGGGISIGSGVITIRDTVISENIAASGGGVDIAAFGPEFSSVSIINTFIDSNFSEAWGGGVFIGSNNVDVDLQNVTVSNNISSAGGGIFLLNASLDATNLTIADNSAIQGGGLEIASNGPGGPVTTLNQSTITGNYAQSDAGGIYALFANLQINNSIVTANAAGDPGTPDDIAGVAQFGGNYILGDQLVVDDVISTFALTDIFDTVVQNTAGVTTGELADNGGHVWTVALLDGGIAQDAGSFTVEPADTFDLDNDGDTSETVPFDARGEGFARVIEGGIDLGAFESGIAPSDGIAAQGGQRVFAALDRAPSHMDIVGLVPEILQGTPAVQGAQADFALDIEAGYYLPASSIHGDMFQQHIA